MGKHHFYFILLSMLFVLFNANSGFAAVRCEKLFLVDKIPILKSIESKLSKFGYELVDDNLYKIYPANHKVLIGKIEVIRPKYLFEWQDQEYHKAWVQSDGINRADMDAIIADEPQRFGRGFYVSLHPTDSMNFGSHLTIFETHKPLVIINSSADRIYADFANASSVTELRNLGFAGVRCTSTWLNIFNESYLGDARAINSGLAAEIKNSKSNVPAFAWEDLLSKPSVAAALFDRVTIKTIFKKLQTDGQLLATERAGLVESFLTMPELIIPLLKKEKEELKILNKIIDSINRPNFLRNIETNSKVKLLGYLTDVMSRIPQANAFFALFDTFDIATIGNASMKESLSYNYMLGAAEKYEKLLTTADLSTIKKGTHFSDLLTSKMGLKFDLRDEEVVMSSYQKDVYNIKVGKEFLEKLNENIFLHTEVAYERFSNMTAQYEYDVESTYYSLNNLEKTKHLYSAPEYAKIQKLLVEKKDKKAALQLSVQLLYEKLFDPSQFSLMGSQFKGEKTSAFTLYKTFVSLHPYKDGNGRAARLYYQWLVKNHFHNEPTTLYVAVNEGDLFMDNSVLNLDNNLNWILSRLWMLSAKDEVTLIARAKKNMQENTQHIYFTRQLGDIRTLLGIF